VNAVRHLHPQQCPEAAPGTRGRSPRHRPAPHLGSWYAPARVLGGFDRVISATPPPRLFGTALARSFQLVDLSLPEVGRYIDVGSEIDGFGSADECATKVRAITSTTRSGAWPWPAPPSAAA
jgi:hypothetical protein